MFGCDTGADGAGGQRAVLLCSYRRKHELPKSHFHADEDVVQPNPSIGPCGCAQRWWRWGAKSVEVRVWRSCGVEGQHTRLVRMPSDSRRYPTSIRTEPVHLELGVRGHVEDCPTGDHQKGEAGLAAGKLAAQKQEVENCECQRRREN